MAEPTAQTGRGDLFTSQTNQGTGKRDSYEQRYPKGDNPNAYQQNHVEDSHSYGSVEEMVGAKRGGCG